MNQLALNTDSLVLRKIEEAENSPENGGRRFSSTEAVMFYNQLITTPIDPLSLPQIDTRNILLTLFSESSLKTLTSPDAFPELFDRPNRSIFTWSRSPRMPSMLKRGGFANGT